MRRLPLFVAFILVFAVPPLPAGTAAAAQQLAMAPAGKQATKVLVLKRARRLILWHGSRQIASYRIALGRRPVGRKRREGDGRTPEGRYVIDWRNPHSAYHLSLHISYPNQSDTAAAEAAGRDPGGMIMIHGLPNGLEMIGAAHHLKDWTEGCIAVTSAEIEQIWRLVPDGTPIEIRP